MYMGVDIGATKTLIATQDSHGDFIEQKKFSTPSDFDTFIERLQNSLQDCIQNQTAKSLVVAAPGTVRNNMLHAGGNISWHDKDILHHVRKVCGDIPAELINDAAAAGLYEARHGNGRNRNVVLYLTISTGIGTSIIVNEQLIGNFANSEGGHMLVDSRSETTFENIASGSAFVEKYGHQGKDETDVKIWHEYGEAVATGLFSMIALTRPTIAVIGGSMGEHFHKYEESLRERITVLANGLFDIPAITAANKPATGVAHGCVERAREIADA